MLLKEMLGFYKVPVAWLEWQRSVQLPYLINVSANANVRVIPEPLVPSMLQNRFSLLRLIS
jgi:hypothetical protein